MSPLPVSVICAVTGASGGPLTLALLRALAGFPLRLALIFSPVGAQVFAAETGISPEAPSILDALAAEGEPAAHLEFYRPDDFSAPIASGTVRWEGMVVCPCSLGTVGRIAAGVSDNLITRAADIALKERRRLVIVPREAPLSALHLENLAKLARLGAIIIPPVLTFYHRPRTLEDQLAFLAGRVLRALGLPDRLDGAWKPE